MSASASAGRLDLPQVRAVLLFLAISATATTIIIANPDLASGISGASVPLLLASAMAVAALTIRYSSLGLPLLVVFVFLNLSEALVRYHEFPSLLQLLVLGLAFAAWLKLDTDSLITVALQPLTLALTAFLAFVAVSTTWATDPSYADARLIDLLKAAAVFGLATVLMSSRERLLQGLAVMVCAAVAVSALVTFQMVFGFYENPFLGLARIKAHAHVAGSVFGARAAGPIGDPNYFAQSLLLALPVALVFATSANSPRRRILWMLGALVIVAAIGLTYSRGAAIALPFIALFTARVLRVRWRTIVAAAIAVALLAMPFMGGAFFTRLLTVSAFLPLDEQAIERDSSFEERRLFMRVAWEMFSDRPLLGVGLGNYGVAYEDYSGRIASEFRQLDDLSEIHFAHNLFLESAAEGGTPGVVLLVTTLTACLVALSRSRAQFVEADDETMRRISGALQVALVGFAFTSLFLHLELPRHLFLLFAFAAAIERQAQRTGNADPSPR